MPEELFGFKKISLDEIIEIIFRRRFLIVLPVIVAFVASLGVSILSVPMFKSTAVVGVPIRRDSRRAEIFKIARIEMRKNELAEDALKEMDFSRYLKKEMNLAQAANIVKKNTLIKEAGAELYVEFISADPLFCQKYLSAFLFNTISQAEEIQFKGMIEKVQELQARIDKNQQRYSEYEQKLAAFSKQHLILRFDREIPVFKDLNYDDYKQLQEISAKLDAQIMDLKRQKEIVEKKLAKEPQYGAGLPEEGVGTEAGTEAATIEDDAYTKALKAQLAGLETELIKAKLVYLPEHPHVQGLQENIAELKAELTQIYKQKIQALQSAQKEELLEKAKERVLAPEGESLNPRYIEFQEALEELAEEITDKEAQKKKQDEKTAEYAKALEGLAELEKQYITARADYEAVKRSLDIDARDIQRAKEDYEREKGIGPFLMILEGPTLPTRPFWPDRPKIIFAGLFFGLIFAGGLVYLFEINDVSIRHADQLRVFLNAPVLGSIAKMVTPVDIKKNKMINRFFIYGTLIFFVGSIMFLLFIKEIFK